MEHVLFGTQEIKLGDSSGRTRDVVTGRIRVKKPAPPRISVEWSELGDGSWIYTTV